MGFLSGMAAMQTSSDFLKGVEPAAVFGWLDNYCRDHALNEVSDALQALAAERGLPRQR